MNFSRLAPTMFFLLLLLSAPFFIVQTKNDATGRVLADDFQYGSTVIAIVGVDADYVYTVASNILYKIDVINGNTNASVSTGQNIVEGVYVDKQSNIYTASRDGTVKKWDDQLNLIWTNTSHTSLVRAVATDDLGNIYSTGNDNTLRKLNSSGSQIWSYNFGNVGLDVISDTTHVYVSGEGNKVHKVDANGNFVWNFNGHSALVHGVNVDDLGNVYTASFDNTAKKLDSSGNLIWTYSGHSNWVWHVSVDSNYNVYTASQDGTVRKLNSSGSLLSTFTSGSANYRIRIDNNDNIYLTNLNNVYRLNTSLTSIWTKSLSGSFGLGLNFVAGSTTVEFNSYFDIMETARTAEYANVFGIFQIIREIPMTAQKIITGIERFYNWFPNPISFVEDRLDDMTFSDIGDSWWYNIWQRLRGGN